MATSGRALINGGGLIADAVSVTADWTSGPIENHGGIAMIFKLKFANTTGSHVVYFKGNFEDDVTAANWYNEKWRNDAGDWETSKTITADGVYAFRIFPVPSFLWLFVDFISGGTTLTAYCEKIV